MAIKVEDLMAPGVLAVNRDATVAEVRSLMKAHDVHALPVVDENGHPEGIVTASDLLGDTVPGMAVSRIMTGRLHIVRRGTDVREAARIMREHEIHQVIVVEDDQLVGMLTSFDLLQLVEEPPLH
jgi:CBS domain-containing protein